MNNKLHLIVKQQFKNITINLLIKLMIIIHHIVKYISSVSQYQLSKYNDHKNKSVYLFILFIFWVNYYMDVTALTHLHEYKIV